MKSFTASAVSLVVLFSGAANAVCAGYNYAFFDGGSSTYVISDCTAACNVIRQDITSNVCTIGTYKCSAAPIRVTDIYVNGYWYYCRDDSAKGQCNGRPGAQATPTSCCRNDGKRNLQEGLITIEEFEAIERRNAELDIELEVAKVQRLKRATGRNVNIE